MLTCWNLLRQKKQRLLVVERSSRQLQRVWDHKFWENSSVAVAGKRLHAESFQQKLQNKPVGRGETVSQTFLINHVEQLSVQTLCGSFWKSRRENLSDWRCVVVAGTRKITYYLNQWKLHRVWISNVSELLCWFETNVIGFETEICQGSWLPNPAIPRKIKKSTKKS